MTKAESDRGLPPQQHGDDFAPTAAALEQAVRDARQRPAPVAPLPESGPGARGAPRNKPAARAKKPAKRRTKRRGGRRP